MDVFPSAVRPCRSSLGEMTGRFQAAILHGQGPPLAIGDTLITLGIRHCAKALVFKLRRRRPRGFDSHRPLHFDLWRVSVDSLYLSVHATVERAIYSSSSSWRNHSTKPSSWIW